MTAKSEAIREVIAAAGGKLVGKTKLQKTFYVLEQAGVGFGFSFTYHYYGPYSEDLSWATRDAEIDGLINEEEDIALWGGRYSTFTTDNRSLPNSEDTEIRKALVQVANSADSLSLELAATAAFLKLQGFEDYWGETRRRKPQKATSASILAAENLWSELRAADRRGKLPQL